MPLDNWGTPLRDVLTDAEHQLEVGELNETFRGFYESEGEAYQRPYKNIIEKVGRPISENRLETWKKLYDTLGLLYIRDGTIVITHLGRRLYETWLEAQRATDASNRHLAEGVVATLGRYQLLNPTTKNRDYPADADVLPYRAIWRAMVELDNKLHYEEFNRVLLRVMKDSDLEPAIDKIRVARTRADYDLTNEAALETILGPRVFTEGEQVTRRMIPWFTAAGFGGLLIDRDSHGGYRQLRPEYVELLRAELARPVSFKDFGDNTSAWFAYLEDALSKPSAVAVSASEQKIFERALHLCAAHGKSRIIALSGVAGTGKTRMTEKLANALVGGDSKRHFEIQFHQSYSYDDFVEGMVPTPAGGFSVEPKIFRLANKLAHSMETVGPNELVVLVIEELSRANLSNVLGELLTYVEHRGRRFRYPLSGNEDYVSPNLVIVGTFNPLDRSVVEMDDALIRRTRRLELPYNDLALREILTANGMPAHVTDALSGTMRSLADELPFGHGVFADAKSEDDLFYLWQEQLQHYFVKATGQTHPAYEAFLRLYPWTEPGHQIPAAQLTPASAQAVQQEPSPA